MGKLSGVAKAAAAIAGTGFVLDRLTAAPHYHGTVTDHFDGVRFHNLDAGIHGQGSFVKWQMTREPGFWPDWIDAAPGPKPPDRVAGGRMRVTLINHATMLVQVDGLNILTDPIWSERCSPVGFIGPRRHRSPAIRFRDLPPIDVVLVSHNHYDHLDIPTLHRLQWRHAPRIITPLGNARLMGRHGVVNATEVDWWKSVRVDDKVEVTVVPAQHFCARAISDRNRNLWGGFVISAPSGRAYFAGDTGWGSHFDLIASRFAPFRLAMLPIGAYLPRWFMQVVHIDPAEAVQAHARIGAETSVPMHYGTFHLGDDGERQPLDDLRRALESNPTKGFRILEHGIGEEV